MCELRYSATMRATSDPRTRVFLALSDLTRLRLVRLLAAADTRGSVGRLAEALDLPPSKVSKHVGILAWAGLIAAHRDGRRVWLTLSSSTPENEYVLSAALAVPDGDGLFAGDLRRFQPYMESSPPHV